MTFTMVSNGEGGVVFDSGNYRTDSITLEITEPGTSHVSVFKGGKIQAATTKDEPAMAVALLRKFAHLEDD